MKRIYIHTLGCPRNQVDSDIFYSIALEYRLTITKEPKKADIILVNTCGFIKDAKEESIDDIILMNTIRKKSSKLIVTGCLVKRYADELQKELSEVDYFIGLKDYQRFSSLLSQILNRTVSPSYQRKLINSESYAYLKISDGCENNCSYCSIPSIRGKVVSDSIENLVREACYIAEQGIKELIITAMDINQYGKDLTSQTDIIRLLEKLVDVEGIEWIRLLYLHPKGISNDLIRFMKDNKKICPYLDIPLQHINDKILSSMNRGINRYEIEKLINNIRTEIPDVSLRTSIILGYPGETDEQFNELYDFVAKTKFNRLGTFIYSREEGTPACGMPNHIDLKTAQKREKKLMQLQERISEELLSQYVGKTLPVIIDRVERCEDEVYLEGRTRYDAPEIDGIVTIENGYFPKGCIVNVEIKDNWEHDLEGCLAVQELINVTSKDNLS